MPGYKQTPYSIEAHFYAGNCAVVLFFITRWVFELLYTLTSPPKEPGLFWLGFMRFMFALPVKKANTKL